MARWAMLIDIEPQTDPGAATLRTRPGTYPPVIGAAYEATVEALGGTPPYTFAATVALPTGLSIDSATGAITGTPSGSVGHVESEVRVIDSLGATFYNIVGFDVVDAITLTGIFPEGEETAAFAAGLTLVGSTGAVTWGVVGTVPGLSFNTSTGVFSGTPTTAGSYPVTITATDSLGLTTSVARTIEIAAQFAFGAVAMPAGLVGTAYSFTPQTVFGVLPAVFSLGIYDATLAVTGLSFDPSTGRIYGTPTGQSGSIFQTLGMTATDSAGVTATTSFTLTINDVVARQAVAWSGSFTGNGVKTGFSFITDVVMLSPLIEVFLVSGPNVGDKILVDTSFDNTGATTAVSATFKIAPSSLETFTIHAVGAQR